MNKKLKALTLEDLEGLSQEEIKGHIERNFEVEIQQFHFLIAYESVGDYGGDSSNFFLYIHDGKIYENHGGHDSSCGFEGQWDPEETTLKYLNSEKFHFDCGGYDYNERDNQRKVKEFLKENSDEIRHLLTQGG